MTHFLSASAYLALASLTCLGLSPTPQDARQVPLDIQSCKPTAPISIEILSNRVVAGIAEIEYFVRPKIEAQSFGARVRSGAMGEVLLDSTAEDLEGKTGFARVRLPQDYEQRGINISVEASISFDGIDSFSRPILETQTAVLSLHFGAPFTPNEVIQVTADNETTLDMPANRTEQR